MYADKHLVRKYAGVKFVSLKELQTYGVPIPDELDKNGARRDHTWIGPALLGHPRFVDGLQYWESDGTRQNVQDSGVI